MKALNPPADLAEYNAQFVAYLEAALEEPTSLVTTAPPAPPDDARRRLAALEPTIPECKDPTFFSRDRALIRARAAGMTPAVYTVTSTGAPGRGEPCRHRTHTSRARSSR